MSENQLFHEVYGSYYNVIACILAEAVEGKLTRGRMMQIVREKAFSESIMNIPEMLRKGKWPLLDEDYGTEILFQPEMPLTTLQKRWLKAIFADPRIRLFTEEEMEELNGVRPLFQQESITYFDRFTDGDPYEDPSYINNFRMILKALGDQKPLRMDYLNRKNRRSTLLCQPEHLEYSERDDKFRLHARSLEKDKQFVPMQLNLSRIISISPADHALPAEPFPQPRRSFAVLELIDVESTMERAMLHFSYLEKETEKIAEEDGPDRYRLTLYYDKNDETELLIRILSFGPGIWVTEPESLKSSIRERLHRQRERLINKSQ